MLTGDEVLAALAVQRVMAVVRCREAGLAYPAAARMVESGLRVVEVSMAAPDALDAVEQLAGRYRKTAVIGVGTVLDPQTAVDAAAIGARFVVAPTLSTAVVEAAASRGMASFPGCATPTEMISAMGAGATAVKIFPASLWTPRALGDVLHALPGLRCVPTGGVGIDDITAWLSAGAFAVGVGSALGDGAPAEVARVLAAASRDAS